MHHQEPLQAWLGWWWFWWQCPGLVRGEGTAIYINPPAVNCLVYSFFFSLAIYLFSPFIFFLINFLSRRKRKKQKEIPANFLLPLFPCLTPTRAPN
jgi:hypothetical protein